MRFRKAAVLANDSFLTEKKILAMVRPTGDGAPSTDTARGVVVLEAQTGGVQDNGCRAKGSFRKNWHG